MTAAEEKAWQSTPAGEVRQRLGISVEIDHVAVERHVDEIRAVYRERFNRELTEPELAAVRRGGEMRSQLVTGGRSFASTHELAKTLGWGVIVPPSKSGFAMRLPDGQWSPDSDPDVVAAAEASEEARRQALETEMTAWRDGPAVMRTIAPPT